MVDEKKCTTCKETKSRSEYGLDKRSKTGLYFQCRACRQLANKVRYANNKERMDAANRKWYREHSDEMNKYRRERYRKQRQEVLTAYGGECECCGENRYEFLAIDHRYGGGNRKRANGEHPKKLHTFLKWIKEQGFPNEFRVLCHNCNSALGHHGFCPHNVWTPWQAWAIIFHPEILNGVRAKA